MSLLEKIKDRTATVGVIGLSSTLDIASPPDVEDVI